MIEWKGRVLVPTKSAYYELLNLGFDLYDVLTILEEGKRCEEKQKKEGYCREMSQAKKQNI